MCNIKTSELKKLLLRNGCSSLDQGGNHEMWVGPNGHQFPINRHGSKEIGQQLYRKILKEAGLNEKELK